VISDLTPSERRLADRRLYLDYDRIAHSLALTAAGYHALAAQTIPDPALGTFGVPMANRLRSAYEELGAGFAEGAADARELADHYRARVLGVPA
jgi:hypothetical protein